ncbi:hypothetical protein GMORB2_5258 [Geosmithia morbida]|uniref:Uncharacterized protein n=1 Tax=Geosmithia morbida TaxID=1094350 RepID=A0A9P5D366_9HYPO|nr:uncharacterized protein GMORB2_5258 [Geosmithia morbida]KAF4124592.1 hypothetical protein GMORB2_5258 [Geosmithia morbida]
MASRGTADGRRARPSLDSLPTEILEAILLHCTNLSLPHASPLIGLKLSEPATLLRLVISAFRDTWDVWFGVAVAREPLYGPHVPNGYSLTGHGDPILQPWAKTPILLRAQQTWASRHARDRWYQHSIPHYSDPRDRPGSAHSSGGFDHFDAVSCFEADYAQCLLWPPLHTEGAPWGGRDVHPRTRLPDGLLTGPWDEEQVRRVFWLSRGGVHIAHEDDEGVSAPRRAVADPDPDPRPELDVFAATGRTGDDIPWETKIEFLRNAVIDADPAPNLVIVNCLMGAWAFRGLPRDVVRAQLVDIEARLKWGDDDEVTRYVLRRTSAALSML